MLTLSKPKKIAIVGGGIAGLGCAYLLHPHHTVTVFEAAHYLGGHSNTVTTQSISGSDIPIDTGFMVYNPETYPHLMHLFTQLGVTGVPTDMSFSVQHDAAGWGGRSLEWAGGSLSQLFAQKRNLLNPKFWQLLLTLNRFNEDAIEAMRTGSADTLTLGEYCQRQNYPSVVLDWFLLPMSAAIWSTDPEKMRDFPARTLLRFFVNHRFVGMGNHVQWLTVAGGSQSYVAKIKDTLQQSATASTYLKAPIKQVKRNEQEPGVTLILENGETHDFDQVILACHADTARQLLKDPTALEQALLDPFAYEANVATLHTDETVMPSRKNAWAAWNYGLHANQASTHYWMNRLQHLPDTREGGNTYIVSINGEALVRPERVIQTVSYSHPRFTLASIKAQKELVQLNRQSDERVFFAGSYFRYGFHEDAFGSAIQLCRHLLGNDCWPVLSDASGSPDWTMVT
ncbi:MAG: FAD-dependent oxidoreductase [Vampirovibrionales bacterium]|nr:FAD-dependent oxidoreductase [Vampirovibrionales bacterium]